MCQPKSAGGRRCAAHMAATRASRQIAMSTSGLVSVQVNNAFNNLRAEGRDRPEPTTKQYVQFLQRQLNVINNSNLDHTQRQRVRGMIRTATEENLPDGSTFYALSRLNSRTRRQSIALRNGISELAPQMGVSRSEAMGEFWRHYQAPESSMNTDTPAGYSTSHDSDIPTGVPADPATTRAFGALQEAARNPQLNPNISPERRITRQPVENSFVKEIGYDREDGRLEVVLHSTPGVVHSYRNVPDSTWRQMSASGASVGSVYAYNVRHNPDFEYSSAGAAEGDAHARRCTYCGQFRAVSHSCPQSRGQIHQPRVAEPALSMPAPVEDNQTTIAKDNNLPLTPVEETIESVDEENASDEVVTDTGLHPSLQEAYSTPVAERVVFDLSNENGTFCSVSEELREGNILLDRNGRIHLSGNQFIADIVNNGDVVRTNIAISSSATYSDDGNYEPGTDLYAPVMIHRDEQGWQVNIAEPADGIACYAHDTLREGVNCIHQRALREMLPTISTVVRSAVDPEQNTPAERGRRVTRTRIGRSNRKPKEAFASSLTGNGDPAPDATGLPHRFDGDEWGNQAADSISTADSADVRSGLNTGDVFVPVRWGGYRDERSLPENIRGAKGRFVVTGNATLTRDDEGNVSTRERNLKCDCSQYREYYHCVHVDYVANQIPRLGADNESARAHIGQINSIAEVIAEKTRQSDWANHEDYLRTMNARHEAVSPEDSYSQTFESFKSDLSEAKDKIKNGQSPLEYVTENATGGMCAPETGRKFGVELEFDLDSNLSYSERAEALDNIGRELHEAGLTTTPEQQGYHSAAQSGWGSWSFEEDCTVSGEIVSPIMHDTPEHWQQLNQVCEIIKRNGGIATARTGSHVHVSTGSFGNNVEKHAELAHIVNQHEDTIYRLATNPGAGTHRPMEWCAPNAALNTESVVSARDYGMSRLGSGHGLGINFQAATGRNVDRDNVEFRQWDGTLDPAVIQTQVLLSAAMVNAAERNIDGHGLSPLLREPVGSHSTRKQALLGTSRRNLTKEEQEADTASTRNFFDTLFSDRGHKKRVTALFAMTKWQKNTSRDTDYIPI